MTGDRRLPVVRRRSAVAMISPQRHRGHRDRKNISPQRRGVHRVFEKRFGQKENIHHRDAEYTEVGELLDKTSLLGVLGASAVRSPN